MLLQVKHTEKDEQVAQLVISNGQATHLLELIVKVLFLQVRHTEEEEHVTQLDISEEQVAHFELLIA